MLEKPPSGAEKIVNSTASVIFSTSSVIFCSYLCNAGNAGEQPANEANFTFLCDDAEHLLPLVATTARGFLFYVLLKFYIMNKDFFIEQLTELRGYFVDVLLNGLEGHQLKAVDKEIYKMAITSINFLIDFLDR